MCEYAIFYELERAAATDSFPNIPHNDRASALTPKDGNTTPNQTDNNIIVLDPTCYSGEQEGKGNVCRPNSLS